MCHEGFLKKKIKKMKNIQNLAATFFKCENALLPGIYFWIQEEKPSSAASLPRGHPILCCGSNNEQCFPIVLGRSPAFVFSFTFFPVFFSILIYGHWRFCEFPGASASMSVGMQNYRAFITEQNYPIISGRSPAFIVFHLFIFIYGHWRIGDFFQSIGFDVCRHTTFQLSTSPRRFRTLISVSEQVSEWLEWDDTDTHSPGAKTNKKKNQAVFFKIGAIDAQYIFQFKLITHDAVAKSPPHSLLQFLWKQCLKKFCSQKKRKIK